MAPVALRVRALQERQKGRAPPSLPCLQIRPRSLAREVQQGLGDRVVLVVPLVQEALPARFPLGLRPAPSRPYRPWVQELRGGLGLLGPPVLLEAQAGRPTHFFLEDPEDLVGLGLRGHHLCLEGRAGRGVLAAQCCSSQIFLALLAGRAPQEARGVLVDLGGPGSFPDRLQTQSLPCR